MNRLSLIPTASIILLFSGFTISDAYAYIDPGSGSIILQALIGVLVGVAITLKVYWYKFKDKISGLSRKNE